MQREERFYKSLRDVFIGTQIEGQGGFVKLMRIKSDYYKEIENSLKLDIESAVEPYPKFKEELFDKLYTFFTRYFTESGSIYYNETLTQNKIYERVYTNKQDTILFWKTHMLYYVKSDKIFRNITIKEDNLKFYFDASEIDNKKGNEKRELIFTLNTIRKDKTIVIGVKYSRKGKKTKINEILKSLEKEDIKTSKEALQKPIDVFLKQAKIDFFINKDAKKFLREQFEHWCYLYFWDGAEEWTSERVNQLQILRSIAFKIIDFISQFEEELAKIWNKPKFVRNSNYVITCDRIDNKEIIEKIKRHKGIKQQIDEWKQLEIVPAEFRIEDWDPNKPLPIDTKYFKELEIEILNLFDNLDSHLDGWLIKSENYQALNTILPKFRERIQTIFIDPPFNKAESEQFLYIADYIDSSWLTLLENRLELSKEFLKSTTVEKPKSGTIFVNSDDKCNAFTRFLLDQIFVNFQNEIIWCYEKPGAGLNRFKNNHSNIYFYSKDKEFLFNELRVPRKGETELTERTDDRFKNSGMGKISPDWWVDMWTDVPSFSTAMLAKEQRSRMLGKEFSFPTQLPEKLLQRVIHVGSNERDIVMDFFAGSGVTSAVAHKMNRRWISIELDEHNDTIILPTMKKILSYEKSGISKDIKTYQGGGFFKYFEIEQYEETLANCKYKDDIPLNNKNENSYLDYVFMKDEKLLDVLEIDPELKDEKIKTNLKQLYPDIDIHETLSNLTGKWIKTIKQDQVIFEDGTTIDTKDLDYKHIKDLIWW